MVKVRRSYLLLSVFVIGGIVGSNGISALLIIAIPLSVLLHMKYDEISYTRYKKRGY